MLLRTELGISSPCLEKDCSTCFPILDESEKYPASELDLTLNVTEEISFET